MIKKLLVKNFEAHERFSASLDPHITTFTGATDAGKSSIIRAIKWLVLNRPLGDSFIRDESKPAHVAIKTEKGTVARKKGKGVNIYKVNGQVLEAFGTGVPEEVQEFLGMEELNFQLQFDAPYWFMISPGEVSKQLNQVVDLEVIDSTLSRLAARVRERRTEANLIEQRMEEAELAMGRLSYVKPMLEEHEQLAALEERKAAEHSSLAGLSAALEDMESYSSHAKALGQAHSRGAKLAGIGQRLVDAGRDADELSALMHDLKRATVLAESPVPDISPLSSIAAEWEELEEHCVVLERSIEETELEQETVCQKGKELAAGERKLKRMIGKTCPLCGSTAGTRS